MSYQISQSLTLRPCPERKYASFYRPSLISRTNCYTLCDPCFNPCIRRCYCYCSCCCCCVPCCYNPCYYIERCIPRCRPRLNFDYSTLSSTYKPKYEKKQESDIKQSRNSEQNNKNNEKIEINEPPKEEEQEEKKEEQPEPNYEQNQFNEFLKNLMVIETDIEDAKIELAKNQDFNAEDAFKLFESNDKGYLDKNDIKEGLNLIGVTPTEKELNLLMKRFDLQKSGFINYADFFDMVVPFETNSRQEVENRQPKSNVPDQPKNMFEENTIQALKKLFELIINSENKINDDRSTLGTLRLKLNDIFALLDKDGKGVFDNDEMMVYLANNNILENNKSADLLFIRLDKKRNGKIDLPEIEDELKTLY